MERMLKVYVYKEGTKPIFHTPPLKGIYASEGWFMKQLERNRRFVVKDPRKAHLFYLPFSTRALQQTMYVPNSHSHRNLIEYLKNYLDTIVARHPFWNRTGGADHFLAACHDWVCFFSSSIFNLLVLITEGLPHLVVFGCGWKTLFTNDSSYHTEMNSILKV